MKRNKMLNLIQKSMTNKMPSPQWKEILKNTLKKVCNVSNSAFDQFWSTVDYNARIEVLNFYVTYGERINREKLSMDEFIADFRKKKPLSIIIGIAPNAMLWDIIKMILTANTDKQCTPRVIEIIQGIHSYYHDAVGGHKKDKNFDEVLEKFYFATPEYKTPQTDSVPIATENYWQGALKMTFEEYGVTEIQFRSFWQYYLLDDGRKQILEFYETYGTRINPDEMPLSEFQEAFMAKPGVARIIALCPNNVMLYAAGIILASQEGKILSAEVVGTIATLQQYYQDTFIERMDVRNFTTILQRYFFVYEGSPHYC